MRLTSLLLAATAALVVITPCAWAQDVFETNSGGSYTGKLISNDGTSVEIETSAGAKMKLPYDSLTLTTQYRLKRAETGDDARSQLELAEWCLGKTLYLEARTHYRKALATDATMAEEINAKVVAARTTAANELLQRGKSLQAAGKFQEARQVLSTLVQELPLEKASEEARQLLADETTQRKQDSLSRKPKPAAAEPAAGGAVRASGEPFSDATRKLFQPVIDSYNTMLDATQEGLVKGGSSGVKEFEKALKEADKIRKTAEKLRPQGAQDEEIAEAMEIVDSKLEEASVDVRINLVDSYLLRTSYKQAGDVVSAGLAEYPKNERLRQAMARVTAAASDNGGGDWVIVGGRGR